MISRTRTSLVGVGCLAAALLLSFPATGAAQFRRTIVRPTVVRPVWGPTFAPVSVNYFNTGSYLHGTAAVIDAQGQYLKNVEQAFLLREQVRAAQLENRRQVFEQHRFERANTPSLEEQREFRRQQEFWRSWNNPPLTEVWSGRALNNLLRALQQARREHGYTGATVPLDAAIVQRINVTSGTSSGLGMFQTPNDLGWPLPLLTEKFEPEVKTIRQLAPEVVKQIAAGKPDAQALDKLNQTIAQLRTRLRENVREMSSTDYIASLRFVNQLRDSMRALQSPSAANYFDAWTLTARSVGELIEQMTQKGLQFAPAVIGNEAYYTALHDALATYTSGLPWESLQDIRARFFSVNQPPASK
ncbi:MAG: hypothetical protein JNM56_25975 [Planctomycetia bacterium]|nr:hypothetical protein [Planctomycetia bacterium]